MNKEQAVEKVMGAGEETINIVNQLLKDVISEAGKLKDFTVDQLPDVVEQFLHWKLFESLADCFLPSIILCVFLFVMRKIWVYCNENFGSSEEFPIWGAPYVTLGFLFLMINIAFIFAGLNLTWLQILVAPKIYLIEYAAQLVK